MSYVELEQFLGRGEEKAIWLLSYKNIAGLLLGGYIGHEFGSSLAGTGGWVLGAVVLGAVIGVVLTMQYRGLLVARRLLIRLWFYLQRTCGPRRIDARLLYQTIETPRHVVRVRRQHGQQVVARPRDPVRSSQS